VYGKLKSCFFHGYYDHYCFLPPYVAYRDRLPVRMNSRYSAKPKLESRD